MRNTFYIIAIGGSAGSLSAITELLQYLPNNLPASFIIIQHLHRQFRNYLEDFVTKATPMKVIVIKDKMKIQSGCVYIVPAAKMLTIIENQFYLNDRLDGEIINRGVDVFFNSLAMLKQRAIGIILSGMGSDGGKGLHEIYSHGGVSIVQSPKIALYPSMPENAIKKNCVQFTLSVREIANLIIELVKPQLV